MGIFLAASRWGSELAEKLAAGGDPHARDDRGCTPLFYAAKTDPNHVQLLLDAGADPRVRNPQGFTPLHFAASAGGRTIATLVAAGAEVDAADRNGHSALHHALQNAWLEGASALLVAGADPRLADHSGETGLEMLSPRLGSRLIDEVWRADAHLHGPDRLGPHLLDLIEQGLDGRILSVLAPRLRAGYFSALAGIELPLAQWHSLAGDLEAFCRDRGLWSMLSVLHRCGLLVQLPAAAALVDDVLEEVWDVPEGEAPLALASTVRRCPESLGPSDTRRGPGSRFAPLPQYEPLHHSYDRSPLWSAHRVDSASARL